MGLASVNPSWNSQKPLSINKKFILIAVIATDVARKLFSAPKLHIRKDQD